MKERECLLVDKEAVRRLKQEAIEKLNSKSTLEKIIGAETVHILNELGLLDAQVK